MEHPAEDPAGPAPVPHRVRRRLDEIFGDVLPDVTRDEMTPDPAEGDPTTEWLRANRPPHHEDRG